MTDIRATIRACIVLAVVPLPTWPSLAVATVDVATTPVSVGPPAYRAALAAGLRLQTQDLRCGARRRGGNFTGWITFGGSPGAPGPDGRPEGDRVIQREADGLRLCMQVHGDVVFSADGGRIEAIDSDSWVILEAEGGELQRLVVAVGAGGPESIWSVDGSRRPLDDGVGRWRDRMLVLLNGLWDASRVRRDGGGAARQRAAEIERGLEPTYRELRRLIMRG